MSATADLRPNPAPSSCAVRRPWRGLRAFRQGQDGSTAVEFGIILFPFLALLFAIMETALVFWSTQVLESAVASAARTIYTGEFQNTHNQNSSEIATEFKNAVCDHLELLLPCKNSPTVHVDVRLFRPGDTPPPVIGTDGNIDNSAFGYQATKVNEIVLVRVAVEVPVFVSMLNPNQANLKNGNRLLMASAIFRNEP